VFAWFAVGWCLGDVNHGVGEAVAEVVGHVCGVVEVGGVAEHVIDFVVLSRPVGEQWD
jgi:hypothetical protein